MTHILLALLFNASSFGDAFNECPYLAEVWTCEHPHSDLKVDELLRKTANGGLIRVFRLHSKEDGILELITDNQWYELKDRPGRVRTRCQDEKLFVTYDLVQRLKTKKTSEVREQFEEVIFLKGFGKKKELIRNARRLPASSSASAEPSISCVPTKFLKRR